MTADIAVAERSYRRCLRCYPKSFRLEHEAEIIDVLIESTEAGLRPVDRKECLALLGGAVGIWLRPRIPRSERIRLAAVKLMYVGAAAELVVAITVIVTMANLRTRVAAKNPGYGTTQWHAEVAGSLDPLVVSAVIATALWLWLAWASGRGQPWAPFAFMVFFGLTTFSLFNGIAHGSATYAPTDLAVGTMLWLIELAVVGLLTHDLAIPHWLLRSRR